MSILIVIIVILMVYLMRLVGTEDFALLLHVIICEIQVLILALVRSSFMHSNDCTLKYSVFVYQHCDVFVWLSNSQTNLTANGKMI